MNRSHVQIDTRPFYAVTFSEPVKKQQVKPSVLQFPIRESKTRLEQRLEQQEVKKQNEKSLELRLCHDFLLELIKNNFNIDLNASSESQERKMIIQIQMLSFSFFYKLDVVALCRKMEKSDKKAMENRIVESIIASSFIQKIIEEKRAKNNGRTQARKHSVFGYFAKQAKVAVSAFVLGSVAVGATVYPQSYKSQVNQSTVKIDNTIKAETIPSAILGNDLVQFLKNKRYNISNPVNAIYEFYTDCLRSSLCGFSESEYRDIFKSGTLTEYGKIELQRIASEKAGELGDLIKVGSYNGLVSGIDMLRDKVRPFRKDIRFAKN